MAGIKFQKFLRKAPRIAPELLPDMAAQTATNVKLYSGDLIPYPQPIVAGNHGLTGTAPITLHALYDPSDNPVWLVWDKDVDIATPSGSENVEEQRFYYTGDGAPKVSTYALATTGAQPYPVDYYDLGLPLPTQTPTATETVFTTKTTATYERDAGGVVTMTTGGTPQGITGITQASPAVVTSVAHGYTTGDTVRITNVEGMAEVNDLSYVITVIDADTFSLNGIDSTGYGAYVSGGVVALTSAPHGLKSGAFVTISGFTNRAGTYTQTGSTTLVANVTAITQALPAVVTAPAHGFSSGNSVTFSGIGGMTALNGNTYVITVVDGNSFLLNGIDSTGFGAFTGGGTAEQVTSEGTLITVTIVGHGLVVGSRVLLRFTSGTAASDIFTVITTPTADTFTVTATTPASTSGDVELDITSFNASSVEVTVVDSTTFTYSSPGFQSTTISNGDGRVDLAGSTQARTYLYTWFTPWEEESIGSEPSEALFIKEGQIVTISNLPTTKPAGKNQVQGIRLYRTLSTVADTEYLRLATLWFPVTVATVVGTTVTTAQPHNLSVGNYFKISTGVTGGEVTDVVDDFTFTYTGGIGSGGAGGTLYHDVSENPGTSTPRYWGDGSYDFIDDFNVASLLNALVTDDYEPPPEGLSGLTLYNNNILVGFVGNELYFSEPGQFHAWPRAYKQSVPHNIVGLSVFSSYLLIATDNYPYLAQGSDPAVLSLARIDARYPCLNKRSIAAVGFGVMYSTHDGLALYSTTTGAQLATRLLYNSDTWSVDIDPSTLIGVTYKDTYLGWHSAGGLSFERDDRVGGFFVDLVTPEQPEATWYDPLTNNLYYTTGTDGDVYQWDNLAQPAQPFEWKSKKIVTSNPINIGAAQVDADYAATSPAWDTVTDTWITSNVQWDTDGGITFKLWVDGDLVLVQQLDDRKVFRLPRGYRSDTFEVGVEGSVRLRSIRIAETPTGLREV